MRCTAHTKGQRGVKGDRGHSIRCERPLGHGGLHREINVSESWVQEWTDGQSWFPNMSLKEHKVND